MTIDKTSHQATIVAKNDHQHQDEWQQHATYHVGKIEHKDQAVTWNKQGNSRTYYNDQSIEEEEPRRFLDSATLFIGHLLALGLSRRLEASLAA